MSRQELDARCQQRIRELDDLLARLGADLAGLWSSQPAGADERLERLRRADQLAAELRNDLGLAARQALRDPPTWADRAGLEKTLGDLLAAWAERETALP